MGNLHVPTPPGLRGFRNAAIEQFGILAIRLVSSVVVVDMAFETGVSAGWTLYFPLTGIDFSSSRCFVCNPVPASPRSVIISRCDYFLAILQLSRNSVYLLELRLCRLSNFLVSILLVTTLPILGAGITVLFSKGI